MLKPAIHAVRRLNPWQTVALAVVATTAVYVVAFLDPYIALMMLPFFALGCARGKHPLVLLALSLIPALALLAASIVKFAVTGIPLVTYDHYFLRQNVLLLAYNDWRIATAIVVSTAATAFYIKHLFSGRGPFSRFERWSLAVLGVTCVVIALGIQRWREDLWMWEEDLAVPTLRAFIRSSQIPEPQLEVPPVVDATVATTDTGMGAPDGPLPDIFMVLQESTFPPEMMRPGYAPRALFAKDAPDSGPLHVHTFAGGTWKTEFSVTTQMRPQEFGNDGLYVFHQLDGRIKRSIFTELKKLGYRTMVFYGTPGNFINAKSFYASIGVDEMHDPESLGISKGWNWKIPDAALYSAMLKKLAGTPEPVAVLLLTINQHGPHNQLDPISDYVTRFAQSDAAYGGFLDMLAQRGRKAGVLTFGDHQPEFMMRFLEDRTKWYTTAYDIRCINFACTRTIEPEGAPLDVVMLTPVALKKFGFTLDDFSARQSVIFRDCMDDVTRCGNTARLAMNDAFSKFFE
jgi:hypothetical protein